MEQINSIITEKQKGIYRVLHTADWHLGKLLNEQSREEEHELFLEWLLDRVCALEVDAIILAGDVFDSSNPPQSAQARYFSFVSRLYKQTSCKFVVISGNHDSAIQLEAPKQVLETLNVSVTGNLAENPKERILLLPNLEKLQLAVALIPFLKDRDLRQGKEGQTYDDIRGQLVEGIERIYEETVSSFIDMHCDCPLIATGHLTVVGAETSDSERQIHVGGLGDIGANRFSKKLSYVALGHIHRPQKAGGIEIVRYSGSPIPLSFSEWKDTKQVRILDFSKTGLVSQAPLPIPVFRKLVQLRTHTANLETDIQNFCGQQGGVLRTWVELIVEDASLEDDLTERVEDLRAGLDYDILKIIRSRSDSRVGMTAGEEDDWESIGEILGNPVTVFQHLLDQCEELSEDDVDSLRNSFNQLLETVSESSEEFLGTEE
jgi:exonuclease SbcD